MGVRVKTCDLVGVREKPCDLVTKSANPVRRTILEHYMTGVILTQGLLQAERLGDLSTCFLLMGHVGSQYLPVQHKEMTAAKAPSAL